MNTELVKLVYEKEDLVGKLCMIHPLAEYISKVRGYNKDIPRVIREYQLQNKEYRLIFINEPPEFMHGEWYYWVAEIGWGYTLENTNW